MTVATVAVDQTGQPLLEKALQPFVARLSTDLEFSAQCGHRSFASKGKLDKISSLFHAANFFPRHG
jgi:hypothetical protein